MQMTQAGKFPHRGSIYNPPNPNAAPRNSVNEPTGPAVLLAERWIGIEPVSGDEIIAGNEVTGIATHKIGLYYLAGITPASWIVCKGRTFEVVSVQNLEEKNYELLLFCKERQG